jgi:hypothetical protein
LDRFKFQAVRGYLPSGVTPLQLLAAFTQLRIEGQPVDFAVPLVWQRAGCNAADALTASQKSGSLMFSMNAAALALALNGVLNDQTIPDSQRNAWVQRISAMHTNSTQRDKIKAHLAAAIAK